MENMTDGIKITCPECGHEIFIGLDNPVLDSLKTAAFQRAVDSETARLTAEIMAENSALRASITEKDNDIRFLSEMRSRLSTKMVGESLEKYCESEFSKIRSIAFPDAIFHKDNDAKSGSKGDYIFRAMRDGVEILSIMFEMKTEMQTTARKHKNEDFLKKLDEDRRDKNCEYAVLVTMLESDNDFYNAGIADLCYAYPKMYAVRPQCFISIISLLYNMAVANLDTKTELAAMKSRALDIDILSGRIDAFQAGFHKDCDAAGTVLSSTVSELDAIINKLEKLRDGIAVAERKVRSAEKKADNLDLKKLLKGLDI